MRIRLFERFSSRSWWRLVVENRVMNCEYQHPRENLQLVLDQRTEKITIIIFSNEILRTTYLRIWKFCALRTIKQQASRIFCCLLVCDMKASKEIWAPQIIEALAWGDRNSTDHWHEIYGLVSRKLTLHEQLWVRSKHSLAVFDVNDGGEKASLINVTNNEQGQTFSTFHVPSPSRSTSTKDCMALFLCRCYKCHKAILHNHAYILS